MGDSSTPIRVAIVDDDGLVRDGLSAILDTHDDIAVVGTASNGQEGVSMCRTAQPDVVLLDVRMPVMDGVEATEQIKRHAPSVKIVILTTFNDTEYIRRAVSTGAEGYILKSSDADAIVESIRAVHRGHSVFQSEVADRLKSIISPGRGNASRQLGLAPREAEILKLIAEGLSNKEIAGVLNLSDGTVRNYVSDMLVKLEVRDRTQLAIFYYRNIV